MITKTAIETKNNSERQLEMKLRNALSWILAIPIGAVIYLFVVVVIWLLNSYSEHLFDLFFILMGYAIATVITKVLIVDRLFNRKKPLTPMHKSHMQNFDSESE